MLLVTVLVTSAARADTTAAPYQLAKITAEDFLHLEIILGDNMLPQSCLEPLSERASPGLAHASDETRTAVCRRMFPSSPANRT